MKIHYHSDCYFFAGCENMLLNFWASPEIRSRFAVSFSYRMSERYAKGLNRRAKIDFPIYPIRFPDLTDHASLPDQWPLLIKRFVLYALRIVLTLPLFIYEVWVLRRIFIDVKPDIIHVNNGGYPAALSARAAAIAGWFSGVPHIVMVVNNLAVGYSRLPRWLGYPIDRLVAYSVSVFVTGSSAAAQRLRKVLRLEARRCLVIHNGIAIRKRVQTGEETRKRLGLGNFKGVIFGVVAILRPNKGHQILLEAMVKLLRENDKGTPDIRLLIEGDGPLRKALQSYVIDNQLSDVCVFVGEEKNVVDFMAVLDVLILPSIDHEDFPNVILEAMGLGKPVIASRLAGMPEQIVEGETGLLVEPRDAGAISLAIKKLSLDESLRLKMGCAGKKRFQEYFTDQIAVKKYQSLYQSLIESENP